jgi:hypothetical protein
VVTIFSWQKPLAESFIIPGARSIGCGFIDEPALKKAKLDVEAAIRHPAAM